MKTLKSQLAALFALWLVMVIISLFSRSYIPIDETRYVTVAWNMWLRGDYLVPWLNGIAYSHKPPLLFWLMNAGWAVFGVNDWWPRLVPSFFALGSVFLTVRMARLLWPEQEQVAAYAPLILLGSALWMVFTTATMFDMLVAFFTLLGMFGTLTAWQGRMLKGWALVGLAIGGGLLAKGPTIMLQILPLVLLAPWWGEGRQRWGRWYAGLLGAILLGAAIALLWAIPAGIRGGEKYRIAIFWGQTADRMVNSFAHKRPLWWYLPLLPVMLFPWLLWLPVLRGFAGLRLASDMGVRFCVAWLAPVFLAFCFISGKQMHYLLPIFPAFALLAARALAGASSGGLGDAVPAAVAGFAMSLMLLGLPYYAQNHPVAPWLEHMPAWGGLVLMASSLALVLIRSRNLLREIWKMTLYSSLGVVLLYFAVIHAAGTAYDMRPISARLKQLEDAKVPVAIIGEYHGTFNFLGRMTTSPELSSRLRLTDWFDAHPNGRAIVFINHEHPLGSMQPEFLQSYLGDMIGIVNREQWLQWKEGHQSGKDRQSDRED